MAEGVVYEPAPRWGHVAAAVDGKLYLWGGTRRDLPAIHNDPQKTAITSVVDVLDPQVRLINYKILLGSVAEDLPCRVMISTRSPPDVVSRDQT